MSGDELLAKYTYDGLNQLIREDNAVFSKTYTFAYDAGGNILEKKTYFYSTGELGTLIDTRTYTYAATGWKDRLTSYNGEAITYDALGKPTTYRDHQLEWKLINKLAEYHIDENNSITFDYDASGNRTRKGNVTYTLDGNKILSETRPSGTIKYYYGTSGVVGFEYDNVKYYYQKNAQGDVTAIYDESGNPKAEYEYDAWGNHVVTINVDEIGEINPFRYRGYYYDTETGLYYLKSRYYDSETGRFISTDDGFDRNAGFAGFNLYPYCANNPVLFTDYSGHKLNLSYLGDSLSSLIIKGILYLNNNSVNEKADKNPETSTQNMIINDQHGEVVQSFVYGLSNASENSCEIIAVHNAKILLGMESSLSETIKSFQAENAMWLFGLFGSEPSMIGYVLDREAISYTNAKLSEMTQIGVYIISFWNDNRPWNGLHTIAVHYDGTSYTAYNLYCNGSVYQLNLSDYNDSYICGYYLGSI